MVLSILSVLLLTADCRKDVASLTNVSAERATDPVHLAIKVRYPGGWPEVNFSADDIAHLADQLSFHFILNRKFPWEGLRLMVRELDAESLKKKLSDLIASAIRLPGVRKVKKTHPVFRFSPEQLYRISHALEQLIVYTQVPSSTLRLVDLEAAFRGIHQTLEANKNGLQSEAIDDLIDEFDFAAWLVSQGHRVWKIHKVIHNFSQERKIGEVDVLTLASDDTVEIFEIKSHFRHQLTDDNRQLDRFEAFLVDSSDVRFNGEVKRYRVAKVTLVSVEPISEGEINGLNELHPTLHLMQFPQEYRHRQIYGDRY